MDLNEKKYGVAIQCMTYNHAKYICDALDGFSKQKTDFPFIAIIVDDASKDNEQNVIIEYLYREFDETSFKREETDDFIRLVARHKTNVNCTFLVLLLKYNHYKKKPRLPYFKKWQDEAKYIAMCEGDDYWTDPLKLSRQVKMMEEHPEYSMCAENGYWLDIRTKEMSPFSSNPEKDINFEDLFIRRQFPTASVLYRNEFSSTIAQLPKQAMDTSIWARLATLGTIHYLPIISSVYRRGDGITEKDKIKWAYTVRRFNKTLYKTFDIPDNIKSIRDKDVAQNLKKGIRDAKLRKRYFDMFRLSLYYISTIVTLRIRNIAFD